MPEQIHYWKRRNFSVALTASVLGHGLLGALLLFTAMSKSSERREFKLSDNTTSNFSLSVNLKKPKPPEQKSKTGKASESGGTNAANVSRFNSDTLHKERQDVWNSIVYPPMARRLGWEGRVTIQATVAPNGKVLKARVLSSCGFSVLDDAALIGVRAHNFTPGAKLETIELSFRFALKK